MPVLLSNGLRLARHKANDPPLSLLCARARLELLVFVLVLAEAASYMSMLLLLCPASQLTRYAALL